MLNKTLNKFPKAQNRPGARERGQGLVEFAVVFPILLLVVMGIVEFGFLYLTAHTVQHAGREGARLAVKLENLENNDTRVLDHVDDLIPNEDLYSGFSGGITNNGISDCDANDQVTVTIAGTYDFVTLNILGLDSIPLSFPTSMRYELCD